MIFTVIASPPKPVEEFCQNLALYSSQCLHMSARKDSGPSTNMAEQQPSLKSPNCPLLNTVTISLSHRLRDHWSDFFETCLTCSPSSLVVHAQKWFWSVDKYGHRQPSLIFTVITSPRKPVEEFCRNLAYEFLTMSRCVCLKMILVRQQIWSNSGHL